MVDLVEGALVAVVAVGLLLWLASRPATPPRPPAPSATPPPPRPRPEDLEEISVELVGGPADGLRGRAFRGTRVILVPTQVPQRPKAHYLVDTGQRRAYFAAPDDPALQRALGKEDPDEAS